MLLIMYMVNLNSLASSGPDEHGAIVLSLFLKMLYIYSFVRQWSILLRRIAAIPLNLMHKILVFSHYYSMHIHTYQEIFLVMTIQYLDCQNMKSAMFECDNLYCYNNMNDHILTHFSCLKTYNYYILIQETLCVKITGKIC